ncbi:MAG: cytochrome c oxidase subunit II [Betaproteobacteria bacterium]|nr:MAG: cytochrome c oxidase subunit II [Betaproteobacteria bacterium]
MRTERRKLLVGLSSLVGLAAIGAVGAATQPKEKVIKILARKFTYSPNHLDLKLGVPVILEFTTADVLMGFNAPDFQVRADIMPGKVEQVRLVPDKVGNFSFLCDIFCGSGHESMNGTITVSA